MNGSSLSAAARFTNRSCCPPPTPLTAEVGALMDDEHATRQPMIRGVGRGASTSLSMRVQAHAHKRVHTLASSLLAHHSLLNVFSPSSLDSAPHCFTRRNGNQNSQNPAAAPEAPSLSLDRYVLPRPSHPTNFNTTRVGARFSREELSNIAAASSQIVWGEGGCAAHCGAASSCFFAVISFSAFSAGVTRAIIHL